MGVALGAVQYSDRLLSDLPVLVQEQNGNTVLAHLAMPTSRYLRSSCSSAGDGRVLAVTRAWYDRDHKTLTKRQIRAMPRSAKQMYKEGLLAEQPKHDRARDRKKDERDLRT